MNHLLSFVLLMFIGIVSIGIVLQVGNPLITNTITASGLENAEKLLERIDNAILAVAAEGNGSSRAIVFTANADGYETLPEEDALQFYVIGNYLEYDSRAFHRNLVLYGSSNAQCYSTADELIMENNHLRVAMRNAEGTVDTENLIILLNEKTNNQTVRMLDSPVFVNGEKLAGSGFVELQSQGKSLPRCRVVAYVSMNGIEHTVYYTLYSGADFLVVDVD
ncbi:MAG: hypothetical protein ABIG30_02445 [Candidatus Aenigmatarchaeota archaeon]